MRRYIILLLITGIVWAQTGFDKLVLKDGTTYLGEYSRTEKEIVYFKTQNAFAFQPVPIKLIKFIKLKDGDYIIFHAGFAVSRSFPIKLIQFIKLKDGDYIIGLGRKFTPDKFKRKRDRLSICSIMILIFGFMLWKDLKDKDIDISWDWEWPEKGP